MDLFEVVTSGSNLYMEKEMALLLIRLQDSATLAEFSYSDLDDRQVSELSSWGGVVMFPTQVSRCLLLQLNY